MHRPSSLDGGEGGGRIFQMKTMPEVFFQKHVSEMQRSWFSFVQGENQNTVPYDTKVIVPFWIKLVILIRGAWWCGAGRVKSVQRGQNPNQTRIHTSIYIPQWQSQQITHIDCSRFKFKTLLGWRRNPYSPALKSKGSFGSTFDFLLLLLLLLF